MNAGADITVRGLVQGVGFRWFADKRARELGIYGFVKNLDNGDVFIRAEGRHDKIEELILLLHKGPSFARVREVQVAWTDDTGKFTEFQITE
jgi:acylphosphatase